MMLDYSIKKPYQKSPDTPHCCSFFTLFSFPTLHPNANEDYSQTTKNETQQLGSKPWTPSRLVAGPKSFQHGNRPYEASYQDVTEPAVRFASVGIASKIKPYPSPASQDDAVGVSKLSKKINALQTFLKKDGCSSPFPRGTSNRVPTYAGLAALSPSVFPPRTIHQRKGSRPSAEIRVARAEHLVGHGRVIHVRLRFEDRRDAREGFFSWRWVK